MEQSTQQNSETPIAAPPKVLPPHYFALALVTIGLLGWFAAGAYLPAHWRWLGVAPIIAGVALAVAGSRRFARVGTNIIPLTKSTTLVTDGVFSITRNPMYVGMFLALAGATMLTNVFWNWLVVFAFVLLIRQQFVLKEEKLLERTFGEDYAAYCQEVRRWI